MKKIIYFAILAITAAVFASCDDTETYAEQRDYERSCISRFIRDKKIKVISENEFKAKGYNTDVSNNEFVLFENTGVYMQIVDKGTGSVIPNGGNAKILCRFTEYNINGDSIQCSNNVLAYHSNLDKFDLINNSGSFYATFETTGIPGMMYYIYKTASVPAGWLVPFSFIKPTPGTTETAKVNVIVPHDQGHSYASSGVYACYYELSFQRAR